MYWNNRFHATKSAFNDQNCSFFREYFDKPRKKTQSNIVYPKRENNKLNINGRFPHSRATARRSDANVYGWDRYFSTPDNNRNVDACPGERTYFTPYEKLAPEKPKKRPASACPKPCWNGKPYLRSAKNETKHIKTRKLF